jgi:outer membrane protein TolC
MEEQEMGMRFRNGRRMLVAAALAAILPVSCTASRTARLTQSSFEQTPVADNSPLSTTDIDDQIQLNADQSILPLGDTANDDNSGAARVLLTSAIDDPRMEAISTSTSAVTAADGESLAVEPVTSYPLTLSGVLGLADGRSPQVTLARERINEAYAQVDRADLLWLPSLRAGLNYHKHEGAIQDVAGHVFNTSRGALYGGLGAGAVGAGSPSVPGLVANFHLTDAIFQPRIARYQAASRQYAATSARNDLLCETAIAYLELLRAEQRLAIAHEARDKTKRLAELTGEFARVGQGASADHDRSLAELAAREGDLSQAEESVQTSSARLAFLIHADPSVTITSNEPAVVPLSFTPPTTTVQELVAQGLTRRPELAEHRQLVGEACERLRRERYAPLIPSVLLGASYGGLGGGLGSSITNTADRFDGDALAYWELRNLGFGEQAARNEAASRWKQAQWREVIVMDRIAQEVVEAHSQVASRRQRIETAKVGIEAAQRSYDLNQQRIEHAKGLPLEALQSIQALAQARRDYLGAVIDHNVAQIKLCRATGWFEEAQPAN